MQVNVGNYIKKNAPSFYQEMLQTEKEQIEKGKEVRKNGKI